MPAFLLPVADKSGQGTSRHVWGTPPPTDWGRKGQGWGHEGITQVTWAGTDVSILSLILSRVWPSMEQKRGGRGLET